MLRQAAGIEIQQVPSTGSGQAMTGALRNDVTAVVDTIAASLSEPRDAIEEIIEPFLIQQGFVNRTPRGRILTAAAFRHLGLAVPQRPEIVQGVLPLGDPDA